MENKVSIGTRLKAAGKNTVSSYGSVLIAVIALSIVWSFAHPYFLTAANSKTSAFICLPPVLLRQA